MGERVRKRDRKSATTQPASEQQEGEEVQQDSFDESTQQQVPMRRPRVRVRCPRCGRWGRLYEDERGYRDYLYVKHGSNDVCYLGPADGYAVVQEIHGPLALTNISDINYAEVIAYATERLMEKLEKKANSEEEEAEEIDEEEVIYGLVTVAEVIRDACNKLTARAECFEKVMKTLLASSPSSS